MYAVAREKRRDLSHQQRSLGASSALYSVMLGYGHGLQWSQLQDGYATVISDPVSTLYLPGYTASNRLE